MKALSLLLVVASVSCSHSLRSHLPDGAIFQEQFSTIALKSDWIVVAPNVVGANARLENGTLILTMPADSREEIAIRHKFDALSLRGQRIRLRARVRTDCPPRSFARSTMSMSRNTVVPTYRDNAGTSPVNSDSWTSVHAVVDVAQDATSGQIDLVLRGPGTAWFDDVEISAIGAVPPPLAVQLSAQRIEHLVAFARAAALIRYLHPADQVATLDWNAFLPAAIERILDAPPRADLASELRGIFKEISPTVRFSRTGGFGVPPGAHAPGGIQLVRWRRHGLGTSPPFSAYREGRDPDNTSASASTRVHLDNPRACKKLSVRVTGQKLSGSGRALLFLRVLQGGTKKQDSSESFRDSGGEVVLTAELPRDAQGIDVGLRVEGRSGATLETLLVACDAGPERAVDIASSQWIHTDSIELYTWTLSKCNARPCAKLERNAVDTVFDPERDVVDRDIGSGITMHLPLAVWSDARGTLPAVAGKPSFKDFTIDDAPKRLAAIVAAWGTLAIFYPYFADQHTDWLAALPGALQEAAGARSPRETHVALSHLVSRLHDNHGKVTHPGAPVTGILPISFRRFGGKVIVNGGLPEYLSAIEIGSELVELDGVPAVEVYNDFAQQVSAATEGLREYLTPARMGMGYPGKFMSLRIRGRDGGVFNHLLPLVSDELHAHANREARPSVGTELAPGIYYLDLDSLPMATWEKLLPTFEKARVIVIDFRGYVNATTLEVMSHLSDKELDSPTWQIPVVPDFGGPKYTGGHWSIRPAPPRLRAKVIALTDARAMSAVETVLQMFRENNLGIMIGETTGGTNGNVTYIDVPGGFNIRFTAMRASSASGWTVHGHGFKPDHIVHPSLEGVRAGRDEILEAAITMAKGLVVP
jgi:hypothetical protein